MKTLREDGLYNCVVVLDCNQQGAEFFNVRPSELIGKAVRRAAKEVAGEGSTAGVARVADLKDAAGNRFDGRAWTL